MMKRVLFIIVFAGLCAAAFFGYCYADKVCREYLDAPFSMNLVVEQLGQMTEGAKLPSGKWSYGWIFLIISRL